MPPIQDLILRKFVSLDPFNLPQLKTIVNNHVLSVQLKKLLNDHASFSPVTDSDETKSGLIGIESNFRALNTPENPEFLYF